MQIIILHIKLISVIICYTYTQFIMRTPDQQKDSTPSPVSKLDGSNKRVIITQEATDNPPNQPEGSTLTSHMETNGSDGTNPNHNYNPNPILMILQYDPAHLQCNYVELLKLGNKMKGIVEIPTKTFRRTHLWSD